MPNRRTFGYAETPGASCLLPYSVEPGARLRLYCLPYGGGSANLFRSWRSLLPPDIELWGVEYPGHGTRIAEPLVDQIDGLAAQIADALTSAAPLPYALFGHSMGCLVAFEACRLLAARDAPLPALLIASAHRAPHLPLTTRAVHAAPDPEFIARLRELNATPPEVLESPELLELMMPILRADFRACETYVPSDRPKLQIRVAAYGGLADSDVDRDKLLAWERETASGCIVRLFPGDHFFLHSAAERVIAMLVHDIAHTLRALGTDQTRPEINRSRTASMLQPWSIVRE